MKGEVIPFPGELLTPQARLAKAISRSFSAGIILPPPIKADVRTKSVHLREWDRSEILRSLLFWDKIAVAENSFVGFGIPDDLQFLVDCGMASRFRSAFSGETAAAVKMSVENCFQTLSRQAPGCWAVASDISSRDISLLDLTNRRGAVVELHRAIPIPASDVPLMDVLEFRHKYSDELGALRNELGVFFEEFLTAEDKFHTLNRLKGRIHSSISDLQKVTLQERLKTHLSSFACYFAFGGATALAAYSALSDPALSSEFNSNMSLATSVAVGAFTVKEAMAPKIDKISSSPYRYAVSIKERFI